MRYTHKLEKPEGNCNYFLIPDKEQCDAAENKLGQLEDVEEELDIDLITLFKALKQNYVYRKGKDDLSYNCEVCVRGVNTKGLIVFDKDFDWGECDYTLDWKDYGKTWSLTKEMLS